MIKGIFYTAISKYFGVFITIVVTAILARLLTPSEFGIVALVTVFIGFFNLLGNLGIGPAIVQIRNLTKNDLYSIFTFSVLMAISFAILFFISGGLISRFYEEPELVPIVRLLSLSVFFNILSIVPRSLNRKELRFKEMGIITVGVQVFSGAGAIYMALKNFSYYAIVYQNILSAFFLFLIFYFLYPVKPVLKIKISSLKKIASFSSYQFAFNFINYFSRNMDNILIGKYLGNASLGFYNKSYTLMQLPVHNLTHVITPVLHPVLAIHQNNKKYIFNAYLKVVKILAGIGFPLSVFLYFSAPELILLFFGPQWDKSIPVFRLLALTVGIQMCLSSTGAIFQATNRTDLLFLSGFLSSVFMLMGISYGVFVGGTLESIGYGLIFAFIINFLLGFYLLITKALNESFLDFLKIFFLPILYTIFTINIFFFAEQFKSEILILQLLIKLGILGIILLVFFLRSKEYRNLARKIIKRKSKKKKGDITH